MPNSLAEEKPTSSIGQIMIIKRTSLARYQDQLQVFVVSQHQGFWWRNYPALR